MRKQPTRLKTHARRKAIIIAATAICSVLLVAGIIFVLNHQPGYRPPPFEPGAVTGTAQPPESAQHVGLDAGEFTFMLASIMRLQEGGAVEIYFANPPENEVYLMCEIVDFNGNTLYRSGLLRPGEYVAELPPIQMPQGEAIEVWIHIYALEPGEFFSVGTVTVGNVLRAD